MDAPALAALLQAAVPSAQIETAPATDLQMNLIVDAGSVQDVLRQLRDRPDLRFTFLAELTAVDYWPAEPRFEVIYLLVSIEHKLRVRLKVRLAAQDPHLQTSTGLWPAANWLEREVWDLYGIAFDGHPDPRRLLMPEDWEGYPLRKDYPVQIRKKPDASSPMQMTEEEFRANVEKDRLARH